MNYLQKEKEKKEKKKEKKEKKKKEKTVHSASFVHPPETFDMSSDAPQRGNFLSPPQPSPFKPPDKPAAIIKPAASRGKVLGKTLISPSSTHSTSTSGGAHGSDADRDSLANLRIAEVSAQRDRVFDDLERAETIILSLLDRASEVAHALSEMTSAKLSAGQGKADSTSFDELAAKIAGDGVGYLAGVKKLHQLLAPHASFVKTYRNQEEDDTIAPDNADKTESTDATKNVNGASGKLSDAIIKKATSNMYAARVEKRLALERSAILKEMIRLEEFESAGDARNMVGTSPPGIKRKHESLEEDLLSQALRNRHSTALNLPLLLLENPNGSTIDSPNG
ncbi:hypothetical protein HJC23_001922 [Cyclotella cryptica]|uniref:Uncharacterized protein n=1 Tax=Cyclotella cryptica TaxID=29204 RepID=A0ABD3P3I5_9STRA